MNEPLLEKKTSLGDIHVDIVSKPKKWHNNIVATLTKERNVWYGFKVSVACVAFVLLIFIILAIVAYIRNLVTLNERTIKLEDLLNDAKTEFTTGSKYFTDLDTTYSNLAGYYTKLDEDATSLGENCTDLNKAAGDISKEFKSVVDTYNKVETEYNTIYDQYNGLCNVTGLLYVSVGPLPGMEVTVRRYGYIADKVSPGLFETYIPKYQPSITEAADNSRYVYKKNKNGYVDCFVVPKSSTEQSDATPVLHARDLDGWLSTIGRLESEGIIQTDNTKISYSETGTAAFKNMHFDTCILHQKIYVISITTTMSLTSSTDGQETFIVDEAAYNEYKRLLPTITSITQPLEADSIYMIGSTGGGALSLVKLTDLEKDILNKSAPPYNPTVFKDIVATPKLVLAGINTNIETVQNTNEKIKGIMLTAKSTKKKIDELRTDKSSNNTNRNAIVAKFNTLSVDDLKVKSDFLDFFKCTIM